VAAGVLAHDLAEAAELLRGEVAAGDLHLDGGEALLALRLDVALEKALELGGVAVRRGGGGRRRRSGRLLVDVEAQPLDQVGVEVALGDPVAFQLLVELLAEGVDPNLVDQDLDPARARLTRSQSWRSKMRKMPSATLR
jgi:hypothetical protein